MTQRFYRAAIASLTAAFLLIANAHAIDGAAAVKDVSFTVADTVLQATVYLPAKGEAPHPGIVIAHGSEAADRQQRAYVIIAEHFLDRGYAVLLFDKRGAGASEGEYQETPIIEHASADLQGAVQALRAQQGVDRDRVGVFGASQSGWVAVHAAFQNPTIAFVISISGPATSMLDQFAFQHAAPMREAGMDASKVEAFITFQKEFYAYLATGDMADGFPQRYAEARAQPWWPHFENWGFRETPPSIEKLDSAGYEIFRTIQFDPIRAIRQSHAPLLYVYGSQDDSTPVAASIARLSAVKKLRPSRDITVVEFADMGHRMFANVDTPAPIIRPDVSAAVDAWLDGLE